MLYDWKYALLKITCKCQLFYVQGDKKVSQIALVAIFCDK